MNRGQLIIDSPYRFFTTEEAEKVADFFNGYLNSLSLNQNVKNGLTGNFFSVNESVLNMFDSLNNLKDELGVGFSIGKITRSENAKQIIKNNNYVFGFFPDLEKMARNSSGQIDAKVFGKKNYGKVYKVLIPKGIGEYSVADATIGLKFKEVEKYDKKKKRPVKSREFDGFQITSLTPNSTTFLSPDASSRLRGDGKINELVVSKGSDGLVNIGNADYGEFTNRWYQYNYGVYKGTKLIDDGELLDITSRVGSQTQSPNKIVNLITAFQVQDSFGIKRNSYRNSNSTIGYMSGYELADMLNTNDIEKSYTYRMTFGLDNSNEILSISAFDKNGKEVKNFETSRGYQVITGYESSDFFKKDRAMTKIGYANSRLSDAMMDYDEVKGSDVKKYNKFIKKGFARGKGQISREDAYKIANKIVLDYQVKTLDRYGFGSILNHDINSDPSGSNYVNQFFEYYNSIPIEDRTENLNDIYKNIQYNLDVGTIAGNIYEGRLLNSLSTIAKQSKNTIDTKQFLSQAFLNPLFIENVQGQRKAQALDRLPEFVLTHNGKEVNIAETMRGFFSNIQEMNYKKTQFNYLQRKAMIEKLGEKAGFSKNDIPNVSNSMVRVLYAESDLAFQDSSIYTNSYAMQIPSMFDNKKNFDISYASIDRKAYGTISDDKIVDFFNELKNKEYDWKKLDGEYKDIAEGMIKNLLGEENYNKYKLSQDEEILSDLNDIGNAFKGVSRIEGNEINYIKASNEATGKFNNWLNKFFMKSDANSVIEIINPEMVDNSILTSVSGSNYANLDNIKFTAQGIEFGLNRVFVQGHGSKVMNDHIKSTTQVLTNLLGAQFDDGSRMFFEGIINEKYTKAKRGFTGTQFARILTTAAYNSINADYADKNLSKADKFSIFKKSMMGNDPNGIGNIFNIFNINMSYDDVSDTIYFDDKNVQHAINAFNFDNYESLDAMIFNSIRKHRKEIFGKELVNDEGRILGAYAQDLVARNYQNILNRMDDKSKKRFRLYEENFDLLKDYIAGDKMGLSTLGKIKRGWFLLTNNAMMMETKKRKTEDGLKLGRLSALTLTELGMDHVVDYIKGQATSNKNIRMVADYISLAAVKGTEFARGAGILKELGNKNYYNYTFGDNIINIANDVNIYKNVNTNSNITTYLESSPLGKIISHSYNALDGKLDKSVKGLIEGFDEEYMNDLNSFFDINNKKIVERSIGKLSGMTILGDELNFFKNSNDEFSKKIDIFNSLQSKIYKENKNYINVKSYANAFLDTFNEMVDIQVDELSQLKKAAELNGKEFNLVENFYENYRKKLFNNLVLEFNLGSMKNNVLELTEEGQLLEEIFKYGSKDNITNNKSFNIFKSMVSIVDEYNNSLGGIGTSDIAFNYLDNRESLIKSINNFNLTKGQVNTLGYNVKELFSIKGKPELRGQNKYITNVLSAFFKDANSIQGENISNISELQQISQFGNISFIIDNLNVDENGNIVPNADLSRYEKIMKTAGEIDDLRHQKNAFSFLNTEEWEQLKSADVVEEEILEKTNKKLYGAFKKFFSNIKDEEQIENIKYNVEELKKLYKFTDLDLGSLNVDVFNKIIMQNVRNRKNKQIGSDTTINLISSEIEKKLMEFRKAVKENGINSNARKALSKYGMIKTLSDIKYSSDMSFENIQLSNIQKELLDKLFFTNKKTGEISGFSFDNFNDIVKNYANGIKASKTSDNNIEDVYEIKKFINQIIGGTFKEKVMFGYEEFKEFVNKLDSGNMTYDEFMNITDELIGARSTSESTQLFRGVSQFVINNRTDLMNNIDSSIEEKSSLLTHLMMTRHNKLAERLFTKGGPLYEISTIFNKASSAFSPREASSLTTFAQAEMLELMKNRQKDKTGKIIDTQSYKDFKQALRLIYGKEVVDSQLEEFDKIYKNANIEISSVVSKVDEIKKKLDLFSHVVFGTKEDWINAGRLHLFETKGGGYNSVYYGLLSRNPHQYKLSVPAARMVMLNDADVNLSFIGKYLGSGNKVQSTQSSLMMLGKLTALGAKGDFDGDTFQILSLGKRSLSLNSIKNMDPMKFAKEFDKRSELFYLMTNLAGSDLKSEMAGTNINKINQKLIQLVSELYFDGEKISAQKAYNTIESNFLSLSHEKARVIKMLEDEKSDHELIPEAIGFYEFKEKKGIKVSRKSIASLLLTLDDTSRNRFLVGKYDIDTLKSFVELNSKIDATEKDELLGLINKGHSDVVLKAIEKIRDDKEVPLFQTVYNFTNNFLAYTGIAKTGEVHDKLTNFREVIDTLISPDEMQKLMKNLGIEKAENIFNSQILRDATYGHEIGDLIESLAISSKKGNVSPDVSLKAFSKSENLIRKNSAFNYNAKRVAEYNIVLGREANAGVTDTITSIKNKTLNDFFKELYLNIDSKLELTDANKKNIEDFDELLKTFLTLSTGLKTDEIDEIVKNKSVKTIGEIFGEKLDSRKFVSVLSNWSAPMIVGNLERLAGVKNLNRNIYDKLFGNGAVKNFFKRTTELLDTIKINDKGIGTRLNSLAFSLFGKRFFDVINPKDYEQYKNDLHNEVEDKFSVIDEMNSKAEAEKMLKREFDATIISDNVENITSPDIDNQTINNTAEDIASDIEKKANSVDETIQSTVESINEDKVNKAIEELSEESQDEIKKMKQQLDDVLKQLEEAKKELEKVKNDDFNTLKTKQDQIDELNKLVEWYKNNSKTKANDEFVSNAAEATAEANPTMQQKVIENISNSKLAQTSKEFISKHKKMTVAAVGVGALAMFFRIFQSNRPVVNLDINEQEYERSQGSVYRNLGQYTMNTNIRSLY